MSTSTQTNMNDNPPPYQRKPEDQHLQVPMSDAERMSMEDEEAPLPDGWIRQWDDNSKHHFYVDTKASPPRSIWVHPYSDTQFQTEHAKKNAPAQSGGASGTSASHGKDEKKGFLEKLKDKAIGTKEEREAQRRLRLQQEEEMQRRYLERRQLLMQQQLAARQMRGNNNLFGGYQMGGQRYAAPPMAYGRQRRRGGGGFGLPLAGGLAGGLLLGSALDGGFDNDYGGGDFGGGDFGGGDFGGGDF